MTFSTSVLWSDSKIHTNIAQTMVLFLPNGRQTVITLDLAYIKYTTGDNGTSILLAFARI